ncbi:flagellar hook-associated protein FlgK [Yersinia similis]|uniref:Flagellar hook-associated protein 1 n=1 Tax=Yersinia similis TaxID=367190 RepID=A0A0T9RCU8_9GAMM|nr:flagellar hook-associated protein FlgK [Yersinia similis]AHK18566.1 flagellar hook protein FlgK [Yersinia similis]CFQ70305.1 flagellar hook-associated protein FlgK [Yersinia similis]CNC29319.1 flagellar hook-associated protein FlgK [Yersinia similis]CNG39660.1 flagellar hook-associated protein FlgK [Yersinia similis]CNI56277.1 flagellar hook-associated protein FlgK [Yersinia similis]
MNFIKTAFSGMQATQAHLNATSMNIANIHTPGYSRQRAEQSAIGADGQGGINAGNGVNVDAIRRLSKQYVVMQEWQANSQQQYYEAGEQYLKAVELMVSNESTSLATGLNNFFSSLSAATQMPDSTPMRQQIIESANAMALRFNNVNNFIAQQKNSIGQQRDISIKEINSLTRSIADYNQQILKNRSDGNNINDLLDKQELQIKKLSGLIETQVNQAEDGTYRVSVKQGQPLVNGAVAAELAVDTRSADTKINIHFSGTTQGMNMSCGGQLGGINDYEFTTLKKLQASTQGMAKTVADEFNTQLKLGSDFTGANGRDLFVFNPGDPNGMLQLSAITAEQLALAGRGEPSGDSSNLFKMIDIKQKNVVGMNSVRLDDAATTLVGYIAITSNRNHSELENAENTLNQATRYRESISGVNNDEEAINLMEYQRAYQSNMKVIATGDKLFSDLLALI